MVRKTLLLITGPAGVGKRPLAQALTRELDARGIRTREVPVRSPRPLVRESLSRGMHAMRTDEVPAVMANPRRYVVEMVRETPHVVDLDEVGCDLASNDVDMYPV